MRSRHAGLTWWHVSMTGLALVVMAGCRAMAPAPSPDPLPSWNDTATRKAIVEFVQAVTDPAGGSFVQPEERIATFDNDGTLWVEQPMYTQLAFAVERVKALAPDHPEWRTRQPFKAVLDDDTRTLAAAGEEGLVELLMASHAGMSTAGFERIVADWLARARHPRFERAYTKLVYQPQLELLAYLRANGFKTFIVSGGGVEFMRVWTEAVYGVPPEQVVGSTIKTRFEMRDGKPVLMRLAQIDSIVDKSEKPVGINKFIGRRPILAFGNSDGDLEMLQWTTTGGGRRLGLIVHHDDAEREYAYDRKSTIGRLDQALEQAGAAGWIVVSMKNDWKTVFPGGD